MTRPVTPAGRVLAIARQRRLRADFQRRQEAQESAASAALYPTASRAVQGAPRNAPVGAREAMPRVAVPASGSRTDAAYNVMPPATRRTSGRPTGGDSSDDRTA